MKNKFFISNVSGNLIPFTNALDLGKVFKMGDSLIDDRLMASQILADR